jgi:hypothetical protein
MNPLIQIKTTPPLLITLALLCFGLLPRGQAVSPPPDGGYFGANTAEGGAGALFSLTTGTNNTAVGSQALKNNIANDNTADGFLALFSNTTGEFNTAAGYRALFRNTTGGANTADGFLALGGNNTGTANTAVGFGALAANTTGEGNVALGQGAGQNGTPGSNNVYIGATDVLGVAGESNACYIKSIFGQTSVNGIPVLVNASNKLGTAPSSERFKEEIAPMNQTSEALLALKPVTFRYKKKIDPQGIPQWGLVAEDVEKVNPGLVVRDKEGKPYTVRYDAVNAMLLNEFLKEHKAFLKEQRKVEEQGAMIARQQKQIDALTAGLQKVSAQLEASKFATGRTRGGGPAPQVVNNP